MVNSFLSKLLGLVLIIAAQMIFHGRGHELVTGFLGSSVTLQFTFNISITNSSKIGVYMTENQKKISDNSNCPSCFDIHPEKSSVFYHITNLTSSNSELYWASLLQPDHVIESNKVQLILRENSKNATVSQMLTNSTIPQDRGNSSFFSSHTIIILVALSAVILIAVLPLSIRCFDTMKDTKQGKQTSNPALQETTEGSSLPATSVAYSILNFPPRPDAVMETSASDTNYAVVSCLSEKKSDRRC